MTTAPTTGVLDRLTSLLDIMLTAGGLVQKVRVGAVRQLGSMLQLL